MSELKPCPFCGGEAELRAYIDHGGKKSWTVRCKNMCVVTCGRRDDKNRWRPTLRKEAIEAWNSRSESEELKFTRQFIHEHGLEFALASAWGRRAEDGK